jgi:tetratricopeptide (TPR) repeat protein
MAAAIECLNEGINVNPHYTNVYITRASCYKSLQMYEDAYLDYSFLIKLEPNNGANYCARGLCCGKLKRFALGIEDLDIAVEVIYIYIYKYIYTNIHAFITNIRIYLYVYMCIEDLNITVEVNFLRI